MAKKENVDQFSILCERTDRLSAVYCNDRFWIAMKLGCDAGRAGKVTQEVLAKVMHERDYSGMNKASLTVVVDKMLECEIIEE